MPGASVQSQPSATQRMGTPADAHSWLMRLTGEALGRLVKVVRVLITAHGCYGKGLRRKDRAD